jgi:hypothetical protein
MLVMMKMLMLVTWVMLMLMRMLMLCHPLLLQFIPCSHSGSVTPQVSAELINPNDPVNRVDFGQMTVNLGHHLENITNNP